MKEYKMTEALNGISDELLLEAAQMTKKKSSPAIKILRIAAIAAAVLLVAGLLLNGRNNSLPYFSVYVHASESDDVELSWNEEMVSTIPNHDIPLESSTLFPEDHKVKAGFWIVIMLNEQTKDYDDIAVFCNGEKVEFSKLLTEGVSLWYTQDGFGTKGLAVAGTLKHISILEIVLYSEENEVLQRKSMVVLPGNETCTVILYEDYLAEVD